MFINIKYKNGKYNKENTPTHTQNLVIYENFISVCEQYDLFVFIK